MSPPFRRLAVATVAGASLLAAACGGGASDTAAGDGGGQGADGGEQAADGPVLDASVLNGQAMTITGESFDLGSLADKDLVVWFWAPW